MSKDISDSVSQTSLCG